jgi:hypothetical protein
VIHDEVRKITEIFEEFCLRDEDSYYSCDDDIDNFPSTNFVGPLPYDDLYYATDSSVNDDASEHGAPTVDDLHSPNIIGSVSEDDLCDATDSSVNGNDRGARW